MHELYLDIKHLSQSPGWLVPFPRLENVKRKKEQQMLLLTVTMSQNRETPSFKQMAMLHAADDNLFKENIPSEHDKSNIQLNTTTLLCCFQENIVVVYLHYSMCTIMEDTSFNKLTISHISK